MATLILAIWALIISAALLGLLVAAIVGKI